MADNERELFRKKILKLPELNKNGEIVQSSKTGTHVVPGKRLEVETPRPRQDLSNGINQRNALLGTTGFSGKQEEPSSLTRKFKEIYNNMMNKYGKGDNLAQRQSFVNNISPKQEQPSLTNKLLESKNKGTENNTAVKVKEDDATKNKSEFITKGREGNKEYKELEKEKESGEANYGFADKFNGEKGNIDINHREILRNSDGSISTEKNIYIEETDENGKPSYVVIPTVVDGIDIDPNGDGNKAYEHYRETGEFLGRFSSEKDAQEYSKELSLRQSKFYRKEMSDWSSEVYQRKQEEANNGKFIPLDKGALTNADGGINKENLRKWAEANAATLSDIAKQTVKGAYLDRIDAVQDIMFIASAKILESQGFYKEAEVQYKRAMKDSSEDWVNTIGAAIKTGAELGRSSFDYNKDYFKNLESKSFLSESGEGMIQSATSTASKAVTQPILPWQASMAVEVAPRSYLEGKEKGYDEAKSVINAVSDVGIEILTENIGGGFGLKGTGAGSGKYSKIFDQGSRTLRAYLDTASDEGKEEVLGGIMSTVKDYLLENNYDEYSAEQLSQELIQYMAGGDALSDYLGGAGSVLMGDAISRGRSTYRGVRDTQARNQRIIEDTNISEQTKKARLEHLDAIDESNLLQIQKEALSNRVFDGSLDQKGDDKVLKELIKQEEKKTQKIEKAAEAINNEIEKSDLSQNQKEKILSNVDLLKDRDTSIDDQLTQVRKSIDEEKNPQAEPNKEQKTKINTSQNDADFNRLLEEGNNLANQIKSNTEQEIQEEKEKRREYNKQYRENQKQRIQQIEEEAKKQKAEEDKLKTEKQKNKKEEKERLLESRKEKQQLLDNILSENQKAEENSTTTIENEPVLENKQQSTLPENKTAKNDNIIENESKQEKQPELWGEKDEFSTISDNFDLLYNVDNFKKFKKYAKENNLTKDEVKKLSKEDVAKIVEAENTTNVNMNTKDVPDFLKGNEKIQKKSLKNESRFKDTLSKDEIKDINDYVLDISDNSALKGHSFKERNRVVSYARINGINLEQLKQLPKEKIEEISKDKGIDSYFSNLLKRSEYDIQAAANARAAKTTLISNALAKNRNESRETKRAIENSIEDRIASDRRQGVSTRMATEEDIDRINRQLSKRVDIDYNKKTDWDKIDVTDENGTVNYSFEFRPKIDGDGNVINGDDYAEYVIRNEMSIGDEDLARERRYKKLNEYKENKDKQDKTGKRYDGDNVVDAAMSDKEWNREVGRRLAEKANDGDKFTRKFVRELQQNPYKKETFKNYIIDNKSFLATIKGDVNNVIRLFNSYENKKHEYVNKFKEKIIANHKTKQAFCEFLLNRKGEIDVTNYDSWYNTIRDFNKQRQENYKKWQDSQKVAENHLIQQIEEQEKENQKIREENQKVKEETKTAEEERFEEEAQKGFEAYVEHKVDTSILKEGQEEIRQILNDIENSDNYLEETKNIAERNRLLEKQENNPIIEKRDTSKQKLLDDILSETENSKNLVQEDLERVKEKYVKPGINNEQQNNETQQQVQKVQNAEPEQTEDAKYAEKAKKIGVSTEVLKDAATYMGFDKEAYLQYKKEQAAIRKSGVEVNSRLIALSKEFGRKITNEAKIENGLDYGAQIVRILSEDSSLAGRQQNIRKSDLLEKIGYYNFVEESKFPTDKSDYSYSEYLDEKLRKALYDGTNHKYDKVTKYDDANIANEETIAAIERRTKNIAKSLLNNMTKDAEKKGFNFSVFNLKNSPHSKFKTGRYARLYRATPVRANEIAFGKKNGTVVNETLMYPLMDTLAEEQRFKNDSFSRINNLGIKQNSKESECLFKLIEGMNYDKKGNNIGKYTDVELAKELNNDAEAIKRVKNAKKELTSMFNEILDTANIVLEQYGFKKIPRRKNYITHFNEFNTAFSDYWSRLNGKESQEAKARLMLDLDATANGVANSTNNSVNYDGIEKQRATSRYEKARKTDVTERDAIKGAMMYVNSMSDVLYLTEHIQKLRAFERQIRQYGMLEGTNESNDLIGVTRDTDTAKQLMLKREMQDLQTVGAFNEYADWLHKYTDKLAGVKEDYGRLEPIMKAANWLKGRVGSNMVGYNLRTPFTNSISAVLAVSKVSKKAAMKALGQMTYNFFTRTNDNFKEQSNTWARRQGDQYVQTITTKSGKTKQKVRDAKIYSKNKLGRALQGFVDFGQKPMGLTDNLATEFILRARYIDGLEKFKGKYKNSDELQKAAMEYADNFSSRILGERSKGTMPLAFQNKVLGVLGQFQLEVNNQLDVFTHDLSQEYYENTELYGEDRKKSAARVASEVVQLAVFQHMFNNIYEKALGTRPAFDIIDVIEKAFGFERDDDDEDDEDKNVALRVLEEIFGTDLKKNDNNAIQNIADAGGSFLEMMPFINQLSSNARVPLFGVGEDIYTSASKTASALKEGDVDTAKSEGLNLLQTLGTNIAMPTGGTQASRTAKAATALLKGGSYNKKGKLQYPIQEQDKTPGKITKALLFGKSTLPTAKEYARNGYKTLSEKQTNEYNSLEDTSYKQYIRFVNADKDSKLNVLLDLDTTSSDKWKIFTSSILNEDQVKSANEAITNGLATKKDYMNWYSSAKQQGVNMPSEKKLEKMVENGTSIKSYIKYQKEYNKISKTRLLTADSSDMSEKDKAKILKDGNYSTEEKDKLYESLAGEDKNLKAYNMFKRMGNGGQDIDVFLDYVLADKTNTPKENKYDNKNSYYSDKNDKIKNFVNTHELNDTQKAFIKAKHAVALSRAEKQLIQDFANTLDVEEYNQLYGEIISSTLVGVINNGEGKKVTATWLK